jgi:nucleoside-triphosphatase THEP1
MSSPILLVTGPVGAGKTTALARLVQEWRKSGRDVRGILAYRVVEGGRTVGYDLEVVGEKAHSVLARRKGIGSEQAGPFVFSDKALALGRQALRNAVSAEIVVVDEIGPLELRGGGWAGEVEELLRESEAVVILVVRKQIQKQVVQWLTRFGRPIHSLRFEELAGSGIIAMISRL